MLIVLEPKVLNDVMIHVGDLFSQREYMVFNLNANVDYPGIKLDMMPKMGMIDYTSPEFDSAYISIILNNEYYFTQFMTLMYYINKNIPVFLLIYNEDNIFNPITEVLLKLIQQRYGYNYIMADNWETVYGILFEDYPSVEVPMFTTPGIINFDMDMERYRSIMIRRDPNYFIHEKIDDSSY